jgi:hypothetical protein
MYNPMSKDALTLEAFKVLNLREEDLQEPTEADIQRYTTNPELREFARSQLKER